MKKDKNPGRKEEDYKHKAGTAWSHSYLNQKPWHPLSYPNQRRKWIAEQTHAMREQQAAEVAREFAQEQEFFRQTAQMTKKEQEKLENLQAVSFMYIRPPGYNAEAARAAEIADERKKLGLSTTSSNAPDVPPDTSVEPNEGASRKEGGKTRVKDVFGRTLPTEEEFPVLKNAPRLETGAPVRLKPFAIEIRNVMCARCGAYGHQSGDRECSLKDKLMPNEEARLKREDPLNVILAQKSDEPLKWELKQQPGGLSPARGGFKPDDPNQQIIPDEDIYDEYGGFLAGPGEGFNIPSVLASLSKEQRKELTDANADVKAKTKKFRKKRKKYKHREKLDSSDEEHSGEKHHDIKSTKPARHSKRERLSTSCDEEKRRDSSFQYKRRYGEKRRGKGESKGKKGEFFSGSDEEEQFKQRHRDKKRSAKRNSELNRDYLSNTSEDDQSSGTPDEYRRRERHRKKNRRVKPQRKRAREESAFGSEDEDRRNRRRHERRISRSQNVTRRERSSDSSGTDDV
ncbi:hypothetical protein R1flu_027085 [Riccia fluitans]|uniref:CBF1-interacting co-repressor CIR N-terminal domain-containing protein n=1 Tax=Riccia fluitans TaxID=41844 RepID=A0ABD1XHS1_9MARC